MMGSSAESREMGPSDRILAPSRKVTKARRVASCSAMSSVSVAKRQRQQIVLAVVTCLLTSTVAQREGSSVAPHQTPQGAREVLSASLVSQHSTEARRTAERGSQNPSTEVQPDLLALGRNLYTSNLVADPVDPTVPVRIAGTSWAPSKASGLLSASSPVDKNSSEVLDSAASSLGGALAETDTSLDASSKGLRESTDVLQPGGKGKPGFFPTTSPTSPLLPDVGSSSRLDVTPAFQILAYPSTVTAPNTASGIAGPTAALDLTSVKPSASEDSPQGEEDLPGTSRPLTEIRLTTHLGQESTSHSGDVLPSAETGFLTHQAVKDASVIPEMLGTSLSPYTLFTGTDPSEATRGATGVFRSSSRATARSVSEAIMRVSTEMRSDSRPTQSPEASSRSMTLLQEAASNVQGPGGTEPDTRDPSESPAIPTALPRSSAWPLLSDCNAPTTLPDFVTQAASSGTEGLTTRSPSWHSLVPASVGSPKSDGATDLLTSTGKATASTEKGTEVPLSRTSRMGTSETHSAVGEGAVPSVRDLATGSALAGEETLGHLSTLQNVAESEATSGFPLSRARLPASRTPRMDPGSSSGAASRMERGPTTRSPHSSPAVSPSVRFSPSTAPLEPETGPAGRSTGAVLSAHRSTTPGEGSEGLGSTSWVDLPASLSIAEEQEGFPTTWVLPSPSPDEGTGREWKEGVSPTAEPSTDVPGPTSTLDGQSEPTTLDVSSRFLPTDASSLPTFGGVHPRGVETGHAVPFLPSWASSTTSEALPSADVTDLGGYREETQPEFHDGTRPIAAAAGKGADSISELPLATSSADSSSSVTSAVLGVPPAWKHVALATERSRSMPQSSTFLTTSGMTTSKDSSEPETRTVSSATVRASSASVPTSTTGSNASTMMSNATLPSQFLDAAGDAQPFQTTAGGTQRVWMITGSPSTSPGRELFDRTPSEWRLPVPTLSQAANRTEVMETSRAVDTSTGFFARSTSHRSSSQASANLSHVETTSTEMVQPNATQAVSPSSTTTDLPASSRILPATQAVSLSSSATDPLASSRTFLTIQAVSPSSSATDLPASSRIIATTQAVSPSSTTTDLPASSRILPATQAVSPSSSATDPPASSRTFLTTQAVPLSSTTMDLPASSRILPATQAVSPSSSATDPPASSRTFLATQAVSPSSSATDSSASSRILPATQAVSPSSSTTDPLASSRIIATTQAVSPSSSTTDPLASSKIIATTQVVSPSSSATDPPASSRTLLATQAVSPSSSATDSSASSRILPATQAVSLPSSTTDLPASSRTIPATQAVSPSSSATDLPASSRTFLATQAVSPSSSATDSSASSRTFLATQAVSPSSFATDLPATSRTIATTQAVTPSSSATDLPASSRTIATTQAVSPSSSATDPPASSRTFLATQAVSPSSSATDPLASSRTIPATQAVSPSSSTTDLPDTSRIHPATQAVLPSFSATDPPASSRTIPATQAVSPSSSATDLPATSRIFPATQTVSPSSFATEPLASSRTFLTTQAVSPSSSATDLPATSRILPTTQAVLPSFATDPPASSRIFLATQAVSPSSSATDLPATSRIFPPTQAVSPSSSATDPPASSRTIATTQAVSPSSSATDPPASSRTFLATQAVSPSSSATDPPASSRTIPATQAVSPLSFATDLPATSRTIATTQAVTPSSSATDLPASSRTIATTQAVSPSSSATDPPASSRTFLATQAVSLSSSATDLPATSGILPTTLAVLPSFATDPPASSRIIPATQAASLSSSATDSSASSRTIPATQAVSPSSSATDLPGSSRTISATQAVSPSSSATDPPASSGILPATRAVSPSSSAIDPLARILPTSSVLTTRAACSDVRCLNNTHPASFAPFLRTSSQLPVTSQTLPPKVLVTTLGSVVGKKGIMAGSSTKVETPKMTYTTTLTGMKPGTITRDGHTLKHLVSVPRASTISQTAERNNITLSRRTLAVSILSLEFHLTRIEYTESLANKSSTRYKKLEREVILTLNKMLSFYETFLQANVLRFLNGSVLAQAEAVFRGDSLVPTPSDVIRMIVTAVEQREIDAFFDWRVDPRSLRCNGLSLKNLDPEVLAVSFTALGQGSASTFGGLTDWGPLERLRNEVVRSLGARYRVQNFSLVHVRNVQGDLDIRGEISVDTAAHVNISWALEALKGLANYSVDLGSVCINGSRLSLQIFPVSFLVTNRIFSEKLLDRSSTAHQSLSWDLSKALMRTLGQFKNLLQVTIREVRGGSLICYADVIFQPPAPTSKDLVQALALSVGPKNYLGASGIQVDRFSFTVAGVTPEPPVANPKIPGYGIALIVLCGLALIVVPVLVLLYKHLGWKEKMVIHRFRDPEVMVETFELDNPTFRPLTEDNSAQTSTPTEALG